MLAFSTLALFSAFLGEDIFSSISRAIRLAAVILAVFWCTTRLDQKQLIQVFVAFATSVCSVSLIALVTGFESPMDGRLQGAILPLHPNNLGILAAAGLLCVVYATTGGALRRWVIVFGAAILGVSLLLTQSRTAVAAFTVGLVAIALPELRVRGRQVAAVVVAVVSIVAILEFGTDYGPINYVLTHDQTTTVTGNLDVRVSAWNSAFQTNDTVLRVLFGSGLAAKSVVVNLSSAAFTSVDGTWPSAYLSGGIVGATLLAVIVLLSSIGVFVSRNGLAFGMAVLMIVSSLVASVFNDVTLGLVIWLMFICVRHTSAAGVDSPMSRSSGGSGG
jgi:hypothetical protein